MKYYKKSAKYYDFWHNSDRTGIEFRYADGMAVPYDSDPPVQGWTGSWTDHRRNHILDGVHHFLPSYILRPPGWWPGRQMGQKDHHTPHISPANRKYLNSYIFTYKIKIIYKKSEILIITFFLWENHFLRSIHK